MGTRGSVGVIYIDEVYAFYNHCDSYLDGLGKELVEFINAVKLKSYTDMVKENENKVIGKILTEQAMREFLKKNEELELLKNSNLKGVMGLGGWPQLTESIKKIKIIDPDSIPEKKYQEKYQELGYCNLGVSKQTPEEWYCLLRNIQGVSTIVEIFKGNLEHIENSKDFLKDSLFCEWGYLINLDTMELEIYQGFQSFPQEGNRFGEEKTKDGYYPCALVKTFPLDNIPENWIKLVVPTVKECTTCNLDEDLYTDENYKCEFAEKCIFRTRKKEHAEYWIDVDEE